MVGKSVDAMMAAHWHCFKRWSLGALLATIAFREFAQRRAAWSVAIFGNRGRRDSVDAGHAVQLLGEIASGHESAVGHQYQGITAGKLAQPHSLLEPVQIADIRDQRVADLLRLFRR
jgi:hypothetical protein